MHTYAIGDIHGHLDLLQAPHDRIAADMARHGPARRSSMSAIWSTAAPTAAA